MSRPNRQRIVIDLNRPGQVGGSKSTGRGKRWTKLFGILVLCLLTILLVAVVGVYLWWRHYQTTPAYSLAVIVDAAQRNDMVTFDRLIDSDKVAQNLAEQVTEKAGSRFGVVALSPTTIPLDVVPQLLLQPLKQNFNEWLVEEIKEFSGRAGSKPFIVVALTIPTLVKITTEENTARVAASIRGQPLELTMQRDNEMWKIVAVKDDVLARRALDELIRELPAVSPTDAVEPHGRLRKRRR